MQPNFKYTGFLRKLLDEPLPVKVRNNFASMPFFDAGSERGIYLKPVTVNMGYHQKKGLLYVTAESDVKEESMFAAVTLPGKPAAKELPTLDGATADYTLHVKLRYGSTRPMIEKVTFRGGITYRFTKHFQDKDTLDDLLADDLSGNVETHAGALDKITSLRDTDVRYEPAGSYKLMNIVRAVIPRKKGHSAQPYELILRDPILKKLSRIEVGNVKRDERGNLTPATKRYLRSLEVDSTTKEAVIDYLLADAANMDVPDGESASTNVVRKYFQEMGKIPLLNREEERKLARSMKSHLLNECLLLLRMRPVREKLNSSEEEIFPVEDASNHARWLDVMYHPQNYGAEELEVILEKVRPGWLASFVREGEEYLQQLKEYAELAAKDGGGDNDDDNLHRAVRETGETQSMRNYLGVKADEALPLYDAIMKSKGLAEKEKGHFVRANMRLVISVAKKYSDRGLQFMDLVQEGNMGVMKAIEKFDYTKGYKFSTYASWWIKQSITRGLANLGRTIRIPVHVLSTINKVSKTSYLLTKEYGREPTIAEIAERMEITVKDVQKILKTVKEPISLENPVGEDEDFCLSDIVPDHKSINPVERVADSELEDKVATILGTLTEREEKILRMRFGIGYSSEHTLEEVGEEFRLTRERIRQIEAKALRKLRHPRRARKLSDFAEASSKAGVRVSAWKASTGSRR
jgi:RNA polymerase sigma factor (sigma-70 family)